MDDYTENFNTALLAMDDAIDAVKERLDSGELGNAAHDAAQLALLDLAQQRAQLIALDIAIQAELAENVGAPPDELVDQSFKLAETFGNVLANEQRIEVILDAAARLLEGWNTLTGGAGQAQDNAQDNAEARTAAAAPLAANTAKLAGGGRGAVITEVTVETRIETTVTRAVTAPGDVNVRGYVGRLPGTKKADGQDAKPKSIVGPVPKK
ncbi:MAG TPA: hypothetical protein VF774_13010 [Pseudoduganella sp.]